MFDVILFSYQCKLSVIKFVLMDVANGILIFKFNMPRKNMYIHMLHVSQWFLQEGLIKCLAKFRMNSFN